MSLPVKGLENNEDNKSSIPSKMTTLNPNAAEFVPSSLRFTNENNKTDDTNRLDIPGTSIKVILDRSDSNPSNNSDDEARQFWRHQLPDDITPDFTVADDFSKRDQLSLAGLSIYDDDEASRFPTSISKQLLHAQFSNGLTQKLGYSSSIFPEDQSTSFINYATDSWDNRFMNDGQLLNDACHDFKGSSSDNRFMNDDQLLNDACHDFKGSSSADFVNNICNDHPIMEDSAIDHGEFLALQFPGFSTDRLADIYYANGCDLNMTIEILTQLELQLDTGFTHNQNSKAAAAPSPTAIDFPALTGADAQNGFSKYSRDDMQRTQNLFRSSSVIFRGAPDFVSAVRKLTSQNNSGTWKLERNDPMNLVGGSSGNSYLLSSPYKGQAKILYENNLQGFEPARSPPAWLETGETVENMYSASRGEARDFARLRNACFQQAREAYLIGNMVLAKKLGDNGKWYNLEMNEALAKAREAIYRQRNPFISELLDSGRGGQERMIDLHGLHVNEALHVLKHELGLLRNAARSGGHRLQVLICVGTGHHTKGARTPARLPIAVERFLLEEGLYYTQLQQGLLLAIIH